MEQEKIIRIGQKVPSFEMETYEPQRKTFDKFSLERAKSDGKWTILVYYPADFTFVCPTELADLAEKHAELAKEGAEVVSVSTDTKFVHMGWQETEKLLKGVSYPMASDLRGRLASMLGVLDENSGLAYRGTFIIDPDGTLVSSEINFNNVGRNMEELLRKFKAFVHCRKNPSEVCPAKWKPGAKTLKPSEKLVGKVYEQLS
ncbi:MAG: peroxiredoxin [Elusimicrobiota bacterium]